MMADVCVGNTPTPNPSPQGGGELVHFASAAAFVAMLHVPESPSPLWGGVRGGGSLEEIQP